MQEDTAGSSCDTSGRLISSLSSLRTEQQHDHSKVTVLRYILFRKGNYIFRENTGRDLLNKIFLFTEISMLTIQKHRFIEASPNTTRALFSYIRWMRQKHSSAQSDRLQPVTSKPLALPVTATDPFTNPARQAA